MINVNDVEDMKEQQKAKIKNDMAKKLSAFDRVAKKAATKVARMAQNNPMLAEALHTSSIPQTTAHAGGMQMGKFGVFMIPNENGKMRYDVANETTGQKLIGGLHLAEGANAIVKLLNKGYSFYSPQIKQLLEMEASYVKQYNDALSFRKKIKNNPTKDAILETRFEESKLKANEVKEKLINFASKL